MVEMYNRRNWKEVLDIVLPPRKRADFQQKARAAAGAGSGAATADVSEAKDLCEAGGQSEVTPAQCGITAAKEEGQGDEDEEEPESGGDTRLLGDEEEGDEPGPTPQRFEDGSGRSSDGRGVEGRVDPLALLGQESAPEVPLDAGIVRTTNAGKRKEPG